MTQLLKLGQYMSFGSDNWYICNTTAKANSKMGSQTR